MACCQSVLDTGQRLIKVKLDVLTALNDQEGQTRTQCRCDTSDSWEGWKESWQLHRPKSM